MLVLYFTTQKILINSLSQQLLVQTKTLSENIIKVLQPHINSEDMLSVEAAASSMISSDNVSYMQIYLDGVSIVELHSSSYTKRNFSADKTILDAKDGFFDVVYFYDFDGVQAGKVMFSLSTQKQRAILFEANHRLILTAGVITLVSLFFAWFLACRITSRILLLEQASNRFASGQYDFDLPLEGDDEIASTGRAFENMMWQIREKYEAINLSPDGIIVVSSNKLISDTNPALTKILGKAAKSLKGKHYSDLESLVISILDRKNHPDINSLEDLTSLPDFRVYVPDLMTLRCIRKVVISPDGKSFSEVFFLRDITYESEIDRMKSEFLTTAAHELRTPLASVMGFSELLMMNEYDHHRTQHVAETINRQSYNLKRLVDDLLDIARIEAKTDGVINLQKGDASSVVRECCELISGSGKNCKLVYPSSNEIWPNIWFDPYKLKQALMNILSNAYKYSVDGGVVTVDTTTISETGEESSWFGIHVTDQGIGMSDEQLAHVGEKFYRADNTGTIPGTGLGIALTNDIISLHNGRVEISSKLGHGTKVTLWIPIADGEMEH